MNVVDIFYKIFESLFSVLTYWGMESFTGLYILIQSVIFALLLVFHLVPLRNESSAMKHVKSGLNELADNYESQNLNYKINEIFSNVSDKSAYKKQWERYYNRIKKDKKSDEKIRVEPFFGLESLHETIGKRQMLDIGGGVHVSLGVLGTFIGLSLGLSGLNVIDPELLREGVSGLINGMKTAFYTSVYGVVLSLIWIIVDRGISRKVENEIDWHSNQLHLLLNADDEEIFLNRLEKITQQQSEQMKTLLTDALEKTMQPFIQTVQKGNNEISDQMKKQSETSREHLDLMKNQSDEMSAMLTVSLEKTMQPFIHTVEKGNNEISDQLKLQSETSREHLDLMKNQSDELSSKLIEQMTSGTKETIQEFMGMLEQSRHSQESMHESLTGMVQQLELASVSNTTLFEKTAGMVNLFEGLSTEVQSTQQSYANSFDKFDHLSTSLNEMQKLQLEQIPYQQKIMESNQSFMEKSGQLVDNFVDFGERMSLVQQTMMDDLVEKTNQVSQRFERLANELENSSENQKAASETASRYIENVRESMDKISPLADSLSETILNLGSLTEDLSRMQNTQNEMIPHLDDWNTNLKDRVKDFIHITQTNLEETTKQVQYSKTQWESTAKEFKATREELTNSMKEFKGNIESGVTTTFQLFDKELKDVVNHFKILSDVYRDSQEELIEQLEKMKSKVDTLV